MAEANEPPDRLDVLLLRMDGLQRQLTAMEVNITEIHDVHLRIKQTNDYLNERFQPSDERQFEEVESLHDDRVRSRCCPTWSVCASWCA